MASSSHKFRTRDDFKKAKELEEARKAGQVAPEKDEEGNDINPHIPLYISRAPFYLNQSGPSLKHQKLHTHPDPKKNVDDLHTWYARGQRAGPAATKYRKGACENCGSMTHKTKECIERPRAKGARWTGRDIAADELVRDVKLDFEGKRDRWNGYDAREYDKVIRAREKLELERRRVREAQVEQNLKSTEQQKGQKSDEDLSDGSDKDNEEGDADDEFKQKDAGEVIMQQKDEGTRVAVRNLRIREDTAKYLRNLDVESAYYDPKTRSMRQDPNPLVDPEDKDYAGDNFVRVSGDVRELAGMQLFALRAVDDGRELPHMHAEPSRAEAVYREFQGKKETLEAQKRQRVMDKYGGEEHLVSTGDVLSMQQSEAFVEYTRDGRVLRGTQPGVPRSRYPEDEYEMNHTSVWGSWYDNGKWGYRCCRQTVRKAYCTGSEGIKATEAAKDFSSRLQPDPEDSERRKAGSVSPDKEEQKLEKARGTETERAKKVHEAMRRLQQEERTVELDDRKRKFNSLSADGQREVTEEELEAYRLRRRNTEDPMFKLLGDEN